MPANFTCELIFDGKKVLAAIVPSLKRNGMHYEVNIRGLPRFFMAWSPLGRYDLVGGEGLHIPDSLVLTLSDVIEEAARK